MTHTRYLLDFDRSVSTKDIGLDHLHAYCGIGQSGFMEYVDSVRKEAASDPHYARHFRDLTGAEYDFGLELAALLVSNRAKQEDIMESGRQSHNSIRKGFFDFLRHTEANGDPVYIVSAGPADWLRAFWGKHSDVVSVRATEFGTGEDGAYRSITVPCGRNGKSCIVSSYVNGRPVVAVGDSSIDEGMFDRTRRADHGLTIGIGPGIEGDINLPKDTDWNPVWAASELFSEMRGGGPAYLPPHDPFVMEYNSEIGEMVVNEIRRRDGFLKKVA
jgi:phosphoserine phosphatase